MQGGMPPDFEHNSTMEHCPLIMAIFVIIYAKHEVYQGPLRLSKESHIPAHYKGNAWVILCSTPKTCGEKSFFYQSMGDHAGGTWKVSKAHNPKVTMYDSNRTLPWGIATRRVPYEKMTWDFKLMVNIEILKANIYRHTNVSQEISFSDKLFMLG